jgi:deoxyribodipyrimidine photolyase
MEPDRPIPLWLRRRKFDPGRRISGWAPELARVEGDAAHAPWKMDEKVKGYPVPNLDHATARAAYEKVK